MPPKPFATTLQKESFRTTFAEIVQHNEQLHHKYTVQFFDTVAKTNYVINGLNGKSMNVREFLTIEEFDRYLSLKNHWQD
jgi:hypothetical protein